MPFISRQISPIELVKVWSSTNPCRTPEWWVTGNGKGTGKLNEVVVAEEERENSRDEAATPQEVPRWGKKASFGQGWTG